MSGYFALAPGSAHRPLSLDRCSGGSLNLAGTQAGETRAPFFGRCVPRRRKLFQFSLLGRGTNPARASALLVREETSGSPEAVRPKGPSGATA